MNKKEDKVRQAAREAVNAYENWMNAEGMFPDPQFDQFCNAMDQLAKALRKKIKYPAD